MIIKIYVYPYYKKNIQILIVRGFFITLAVGGVIGIWNGLDLIKEFPFNVQVAFDALVLIFLVLACLYTLGSNALNLLSFVSALGFEGALSYTRTTKVMFVVT